jgi:4-hydroxy-2-oxoheptanedioate aldolase
MPAPVNILKKRLQHNDIVIGTWLSLASPLVAEAMSCVGYDFLVVDGEHAPLSPFMVLGQLQAMAGSNASPVVRVSSNDQIVIKSMLDVGAQSILIPMVQTVAEAADAVRSVRYPPDGIRGVGSLHRAAGYGLTENYARTANAQIAVIVQIETKLALGAVQAITEIDGVDCVFVGPSDLAASLGHLGDPSATEVQNAIADVAETCSRGKMPSGILARDVAEAVRYQNMGYQLIAISSDVSFMARGAKQALAELSKNKPL